MSPDPKNLQIMKSLIRFIFPAFLLGLLFLAACEDPDGPDDGDVRAKYTFTWTCSESGGMNYPVTITEDPSNTTQVLIANFHYLGNSEKAYAIATSNNLTIPSQDVCGNTVNGSGTLVNANKITLRYYVNNHVDIDTVDASYTR